MLWKGYRILFYENIQLTSKNPLIHIRTGAGMEEVMDTLKKRNVLKNPNEFFLLAKIINYPQKIYPGCYQLVNGWNNFELLKCLRAGTQTPVNVTFQSHRLKKHLAQKIATMLETDSLELLKLLSDPVYTDSLGFDTLSISVIFIPNTYEFYWNTNAKNVIARMVKEYRKFWNFQRKEKAKLLRLTQHEVTTLASIVEAETNYEPEKRDIAGVYLNRLRMGMPLQADPTLIFAVGDFSIKRVTAELKTTESPFNTYKHAGLPPGPINFPTISSIDAVLKSSQHNYLYFCAKEDMSGSHNFAETFSEHLKNAAKYQRALNERGVR